MAFSALNAMDIFNNETHKIFIISNILFDALLFFNISIFC